LVVFRATRGRFSAMKIVCSSISTPSAEKGLSFRVAKIGFRFSYGSTAEAM
jgi:hypothetical protein